MRKPLMSLGWIRAGCPEKGDYTVAKMYRWGIIFTGQVSNSANQGKSGERAPLLGPRYCGLAAGCVFGIS